MPFNWQDYLDLAQELSQRQDEAALRSAISRAYYGAFCSARICLEDKGVTMPTDGRDSHLFVWQQFYNKGKTQSVINQKGIGLKNLRKQADYDRTITDLAPKVAMALSHAKAVIHWLGTLR